MVVSEKWLGLRSHPRPDRHRDLRRPGHPRLARRQPARDRRRHRARRRTETDDRHEPTRIVDAHVHLWDPANTSWYPYLSMAPSHGGTGDAARMNRRFDVETYRPSRPSGTSRSSSTWPRPPDPTRSRRPSSSTGRPWPTAGPTPSSADCRPPRRGRRRRPARPPDDRASLPRRAPYGPAEPPRPRPGGARRAPGAQPRLRAHDPPRPAASRPPAELSPASRDLTIVVEHTGWPRFRTPTRNSHSGKKASTPWPPWATMWSASSRD